MRKKSTKEEDERLRERLVQVTVELGRSDDPLVMQKVANAASVSLSTLYRVMRGKDALLHDAAVVLQGSALAQIGNPRAGESWHTYAVRAAICAHEEWVAHPSLSRLILNGDGSHGIPGAAGCSYGRSNPFNPVGIPAPHARMEVLVASVWVGTTLARLNGHLGADHARVALADAVTMAFTILRLPSEGRARAGLPLGSWVPSPPFHVCTDRPVGLDR